MAHQPGPLSSQAALAPKGDLVLKGFTIPKSSREKFKENGFIFCDASYKGITDSKIDVVARVINKKKIWKYKRFVMRELYNWSIVKDYAKRAGESENNNQCLNFLEAIQTYENLYLFYEKPKELDWTKQGTKGNSRLEEIFYNLCSHFMRLKNTCDLHFYCLSPEHVFASNDHNTANCIIGCLEFAGRVGAEIDESVFTGALKYFCAPELKDGKQITECCDAWSFGMLMLYVLTGSKKCLFDSDEKASKLLEDLKRQSADFASVKTTYKINDHWIPVIARCLVYDSSKRTPMDQLRTDLGKIRQEKMIEKVTTEKEKELQEKLYKFPKTSRAKLTDMKDTMIAFESIGAILHNVIFWKIMEGQDAYYMEEPLTGFTSLAEIMKKPTNERGFSIRTLAQELMEVILQLVELKRYHNEISTSSVFVSCKDKKLTVCLSEFFRYPEHNKELKEYTPAFMIFEDKKDNYNMVNQLSNVLAAMLESEEKQGGGISDETKKDMNEYNDFQNKIKDKTDIKALRLCEYISNIEGLREVNNFREEYSIVEKGEGCPNGILGEGGFGKIYLVESNKEKSVPGSGPRQRYALKVMDYSSKITRPLIAREISIMKTLNKMNLKGCVKLIDYFLSQKKAIIVEELLEKDLEKYSFKNVLSEDELWLVAETLAKLLKECHKLNIIHKDIKPSNLMVNLNKEKTKIAEVRLIDFGLAKEIASAQNVSSAGTREFLCPQIAHPEKFKSEEKKEPLPSEVYKSIYKYNDVYAFGVTLFMLISGGKKTSLVPVETSVEKDKIEEDVKKQWKERTRKESTTMKISKIAKLIADCVAYEEQPTMEKVCGEYFPDAKDTK